ncbi:Penicillin-binding protein 4* [Polaribacter huanghezhanensis]|uniref:serine hydrolase domain-containing protein n=1 Tax=Polaribacter huanghezhanensis TaxID=1354726 RepID=UPI002648BB9A|nr:serine hydrolase domain-containing protein [Polaribacter huanghezhanensis]WKD85662.1 Penicillin-binding protein 4* [Polaribacter huanghezhanensis]
MKIKLKYFIGLFIIVVSSFLLSTNTVKATPKVALKKTIIDSIIVKEPTIILERYSKNKTEKVSHKLDSLLKKIHKRHDFNGSILIAKKGKIVYQNHIGYADFRKKSSLNEKSVYQLASVSKQFTAASIMILKERNQLKLTDTVTKYFPKFPFKNITILQLLHHTSGLPNYFWVAENKWEKEKAPSNKEMMKFLETSKVSTFFSPGRKFDYSNTGYFVLASIIEKISKMSYSNFVESAIFKPLKMSHSFAFSFEKDTVKSNQLIGYRLYRGWRHRTIPSTVNDAIVGDKNIYATTQDLLKWVNGLNSGKLISKESLDLMYTKGKTKYGRKFPYGFGFRINTKNDAKIIYHYGKWNGFSTGITQYLEEDLVVIILEHTSYRSMDYLNKKIRNIVEKNFES